MSAPPLSRGAPAFTACFGADAKQRMRLLQSGMAMLLALSSVLNMHYLVWAGLAPWQPVAWWTLAMVGGFLLFFAAIRSGFNLRAVDPALTQPQMLFAIACGAAGYAIAGAGRGGAFPILMGVFMFGMHSLTPRQMWRMGLVAVAIFGATMAGMSRLQPGVFPSVVEWSHFFMLTIMVPTVAVLTGQLHRMRERLRRQKKDLAVALARIQDLATRDELTGLINRRHMAELLEQELQRGVRSGQTFCIALIDIDDLATWIEGQGNDFGDRFLQSFAREALGVIRISDLLSRWDARRFLLMLSDTRTPLARLSVERLRERVHAMPSRPHGEAALTTHLSVGVAEHRAGEAVAQTIERAELALAAAHSAGGNRVMLA